VTDDSTFDPPDDPAAVAAATPESGPDGTADPVYAVGIGPGDDGYLTRRGDALLADADVVVGFETVVDYVRDRTDADLLTCGYDDEAATLATFADRVAAGESGVGVLMGDPNHSGYQFVGKVQSAVDRPVRVIPGISSLQVAASRARTPMEETTFVTLHKSGDLAADFERLERDAGERNLLVLPRPYDWMPEDVAARLLDADSDATASDEALVLERLTHPDEQVTRTTLGDLAAAAGDDDPEDTQFTDLSVLAVRRGRD